MSVYRFCGWVGLFLEQQCIQEALHFNCQCTFIRSIWYVAIELDVQLSRTTENVSCSAGALCQQVGGGSSEKNRERLSHWVFLQS